MSMWKILSDSQNGFRWEFCGEEAVAEPSDHQQLDPGIRLPSMGDLLLQGQSKLREGEKEASATAPMFRTGVGKPMAVKPSSIAKALSLFGGEDFPLADEAHASVNAFGSGFSNSLFQTASGKMVNVSPAGLVRARMLLGLEEGNGLCASSGLERTETASPSNEFNVWKDSFNLKTAGSRNNTSIKNLELCPAPFQNCFLGVELKDDVKSDPIHSKMGSAALWSPPIKFQTAGGRSISVSSDALQRARSLLGDPELGNFLIEGGLGDSKFPGSNGERSNGTVSDKESDPCSSFSNQERVESRNSLKPFISPLCSLSKANLTVKPENNILGSNLMAKFDEVGNNTPKSMETNINCLQQPISMKLNSSNSGLYNFLSNGVVSKINPLRQSSRVPLADISNNNPVTFPVTGDKRRLRTKNSPSPFKKPRSSKFSTPLKANIPCVPHGLPPQPSESPSSDRFFTRYPFQVPRMYVKEYFGMRPLKRNMLEHLPHRVKKMTSYDAEIYTFYDDSGTCCIGAEAFSQMLVRCGASVQYASKEWVTNHYKWIVWKLACYERCYPEKSAGKFLTIPNVLEELKYRYEREVNLGHRSAIKRILEGDASRSSMLVLCISGIHSNSDQRSETVKMESKRPEALKVAKVELTDGWYSVDAVLDDLLSKQVAAGKLFVGQKLRIWGAGLCGWDGPVSPLEAKRTANLLLHINGTYRAHWADRLGFCQGAPTPLAFRCIKSNGGLVPFTLVGVSRIYPVLYKERLSDGRTIVRTEKMENKKVESYKQRCLDVMEGITSEFQRELKGSHIHNDCDSEGAKISKMLETAAEPEVLMAEMSSEQLASFAAYQAKLEATRQSDREKTVKKALVEAGLKEREVTPFMRVRVVGLIHRNSNQKSGCKQGFITIWDPTEKQKCELVEGKAYAVTGLVAMNSDSDILFLQSRGSSAKWKLLSSSAMEQFDPRKLVSLSCLGDVPLSSEFDIIASVVYVGEVYVAAHQKRQWVFVTDDSASDLKSEDLSDSLLAINFFSPHFDEDSCELISCNLEGSTVGFCNLLKKTKDQVNHLWVAEATENATYFLDFERPHLSHLKNAAASVKNWAKISGSIIDALKEKVSWIVGASKV